MPSGKDSNESNSSDPRFNQSAVSNITANDIQIGQIVQKIVYLGLPFNGRHLRFVQLLANSLYLTCLIVGFVRLWNNGADFITLLLLLIGSGLLSLTCLYYAWFWNPEVQDKNARRPKRSDSDDLLNNKQTKQRSRQRTRYLAMVGVFAIPLLTYAGFLVWRALPAPSVLLLVANFANSSSQNHDYQDDRQVTENILRNLRSAISPYNDVKLKALNRPIIEQQGSKAARVAGEQKKATIVIWGNYGVSPTNVQVSANFEVLKPPKYFPELDKKARGESQILAVAELNSFKLQTRLSNQMSYLTLFTLGMVQYAKEDWNESISMFSAALSQVKESETVLEQEAIYFYRGTSYFYTGDYNNAIADFNQTLKLKPDYADTYNNRGVAYNRQGKYAEAIADFNQALKLKPDSVEAYNNRGIAYNRQDKYTEAIADFNLALKLKPDYAETYYNRGVAYNRQGKYTEAIADFNLALKLKPDYAEASNDRGSVYANQGKYTEAIADFDKALKLKPDLAEAYNNRGSIYNYQGKYAKALADLDKALQLKPDFAEAYNNRGFVYNNQGKYTEALTDLDKALQLKPDFAWAYYNKACGYSLRHHTKEAIENLKQSIQLDPRSRETAKKDRDFNNIRQSKQFRALVGE